MADGSEALKLFRGYKSKLRVYGTSLFLLNSFFSLKGSLGLKSPSKLYSRLVTLRCRNTTERLTFLISSDSQDLNNT